MNAVQDGAEGMFLNKKRKGACSDLIVAMIPGSFYQAVKVN